MNEYKPPGYQLWGQYGILTLPDNLVSVITYPTIEEAKKSIVFLENMLEEVKKRAEEEYAHAVIDDADSSLEYYNMYQDVWKGRRFKIITRDISKWRTLDGEEIDSEGETARHNS